MRPAGTRSICNHVDRRCSPLLRLPPALIKHSTEANAGLAGTAAQTAETFTLPPGTYTPSALRAGGRHAAPPAVPVRSPACRCSAACPGDALARLPSKLAGVPTRQLAPALIDSTTKPPLGRLPEGTFKCGGANALQRAPAPTTARGASAGTSGLPARWRLAALRPPRPPLSPAASGWPSTCRCAWLQEALSAGRAACACAACPTPGTAVPSPRTGHLLSAACAERGARACPGHLQQLRGGACHHLRL